MKNKDLVSPSLMCTKLIDLCDTSLSRLSHDISLISDDACPILLGYLDCISVLISHSNMICKKLRKNL